jgi:hypothetical protein
VNRQLARVVAVLDYLFGLPVTSGPVGVLEGRYFTPGDALCRPHHPLERLAVEGGAVTVPGSDTARQDALDCASVISYSVKSLAYYLYGIFPHATSQAV